MATFNQNPPDIEYLNIKLARKATARMPGFDVRIVCLTATAPIRTSSIGATCVDTIPAPVDNRRPTY